MIEIDGSNAGGQILRTALGLSAVTGKAFKISDIRGSRGEGGLKEQHLQGVLALQKLCNAEVKDAFIGSKDLAFKPEKIVTNRLSVKIKTAGSIGLLLQSLLIASSKNDLKIEINGGATYNKWAPPVVFLQNVLDYFFERMGYKVNFNIEREGFYPKGEAIVKVQSNKAELRCIEILDKGKIKSIEGESIASFHLRKAEVAERQAKSAKRVLFNKFKISPKIKIRYAPAICAGSGICLWIKTENSILGGDSLGELGKRSESIGEEAAKKLVFEYENGAVDMHCADNLLPYMALAGGGKIKTSKITDHIKTNSWVIEKFLDVKFDIDENGLIWCRKV